MTTNLAIYCAFLAVLYFYPNRQGSVGYFWICCFVLLQWLATDYLGVEDIIATSVAGISLLLTFEISRRLWEEPFSHANVMQGLFWLFAKLGSLLSLIGLGPKTKLLDFKDCEETQVVRNYLNGGDWDAAEVYLQKLHANDRHRVIDALTEVKGKPRVFDDWIDQRPESAMAHIVSGHHLIHWAWEARGSGRADTVTQEGIQLFFVRLFSAKEMLEKAIALDNRYADPYVGLITITMGTGDEPEKVWEYFAKALVHSRDHFGVHVRMVNALAEKWGGSAEDMFRVARQPLVNRTDNNPLAGIIALAHIEQWLYLGMCELEDEAQAYFRQESVRSELQEAYAQTSGCSLKSAGVIEALNAFLFCFHAAGMNSLARDVLTRLEGNFVEHPWRYYEDSFMATFNDAYAVDHAIASIVKAQVDLPGREDSDPTSSASDSYSPQNLDLEIVKESSQKRVFKTPIVTPLSVMMVILIYVGYVLFHALGSGDEMFVSIKAISFDLFLLCEVGMIFLILYNKKQIDNFLHTYPVISSTEALDMLKPIARTNMYSSLFLLVFLGLGSLMAIMTIVNFGGLKGVAVGVLCALAGLAINWYNPSEQRVKQIECTDSSLDDELTGVLECWMNKPFPNF